MTIRSIEELITQANTTLADNTAGDISAADVRDLIKDFLDTVSPAYGVIECASVSKAILPVFSPLAPFTSVIEATPGYYQTDLAAGTITRLKESAGLPKVVDLGIVSGSVACGVNASVTIQVFRNGAPTAFAVTVTGRGSANPAAFSLVGFTSTDGPGDVVYELRVAGESTIAVFTNLSLVMQAQPVRYF